MKSMLNFEKISHLYLQQKVDGFKKIIQGCLEKHSLLKNNKLHLGYLRSDTENDVSLIDALRTNCVFMNYKDFCYVRDGYCFRLSIGYDLLNKKETSNIVLRKDNRENGIYVYLNEELKEVLLCSL